MTCIPKTQRIVRMFIIVFVFSFGLILGLAQEPEIISAETVDQLQSVQQIDFTDIGVDIEIGWFATNDDASNFIMIGNNSNVYSISEDGSYVQWSYVRDPEKQVFTLIDAMYNHDVYGVVEQFILYFRDGEYFINDQKLTIDGTPVNLGYSIDSLSFYVEVILEDGEVVIYEFSMKPALLEPRLQDRIPYPLNDIDEPIMRVGRIEFPNIIASSLENNIVHVYTLNDRVFKRTYDIENGPAVFGATNPRLGDSSHFAWVDPNSTYLNILDLEFGENRIVAELDNLYAQYYLLSQDASLVIAVNVDFEPIVIAWDTGTGERYELGEYRSCERIPDKVELSSDGTALVIGCDTGLDIWKIVDETE